MVKVRFLASISSADTATYQGAKSGKPHDKHSAVSAKRGEIADVDPDTAKWLVSKKYAVSVKSEEPEQAPKA